VRSARRWQQPNENDECRAFVDWTKYVRYKGEPLFDRLVKIPNERGKSGPMTAILTALGMKPGFPDYELLVPLPPYAGLFLEAKRADGGRVDPEQEAWRAALVEFGYHAEICAGAPALIGATRRYLRRAEPRHWHDPGLHFADQVR
jgi:hypothetical protein